jgi:hypothetical protein
VAFFVIANLILLRRISRIAHWIGAANGSEAPLITGSRNSWQPPHPGCHRCQNILFDLCEDLQDRPASPPKDEQIVRPPYEAISVALAKRL